MVTPHVPSLSFKGKVFDRVLHVLFAKVSEEFYNDNKGEK